MVLRLKELEMASEQPVKKKLRRAEEDTADEVDFIRDPNNGVTDLSALQLSLPVNVNEDDITFNTVNDMHSGKCVYRTSEGGYELSQTNNNRHSGNHESNNQVSKSSPSPSTSSYSSSTIYITDSENISIKPAPDIGVSNHDNFPSSAGSSSNYVNPNKNIVNDSHKQYITVQSIVTPESGQSDEIPIPISNIVGEYEEFQTSLIKNCLCNISGVTFLEYFHHSRANHSVLKTLGLVEWPTSRILQLLSNLQLLFEVYLKQNTKGYICSQIVSLCESIASDEYNIIEEIISLSETRNKYINYLTPKVLSSFLIMSKANINNEWVENIVGFLSVDNLDYIRMNFALEIIKRVVEWKDVEIHILEDSSSHDSSATNSQNINPNCVTVPFSDSESFDTSAIKGLIIKSLEAKWPDLLNRMQYLISNNNSVQVQTCILTFLTLWESIISVKANLSVIDTKPFYANIEKFIILLHSNLSPLIWKRLLSLFNEVLCYGSTLALQDILPNDVCELAHLFVRYVKDSRLLDNLPYRTAQNLAINSFVGTIESTSSSQPNIDKTLLQKMVLLVLKSVAITVKEMRSDSSDSSVGSDDYDYFQDMQVIERSIRNVVKKLDSFVKSSLDFHPETPFSKVLVRLFSDQDDYMIEAMVCTLDITVGISYRNSVYPDLLIMLNPVHSFIEFLKVVSHHSDVLLDYLVSNETCFLLYLLRFLKYIKKNWDKFLTSCCEGVGRTNDLDSTMTVLIRLKFQISRLVARDLFPYNINPVLRYLEMCESMYEGNEYS